MSENILQTVQHVVQDIIAPDVRELKAAQIALEKQIAALEKHMDMQLDSLSKQTDSRFDSLQKQSDVQFSALLTAIAESRAQAEMISMRVVASLSERVAVLEAQRH
jgi:succinate dehydrogenase flavin-adding protein (antitoxin of CptAB toxin-antitoxin module)